MSSVQEEPAASEPPFDPSSRYDGDDPIVSALWTEVQTVIDPDIGLSLVDLGLVYDVRFDPEAKKAHVIMTLTSMGCPAAPFLQGQVMAACKRVPGVEDAIAEVVFSPAWNPREMATEDVQMLLGIF